MKRENEEAEEPGRNRDRKKVKRKKCSTVAEGDWPLVHHPLAYNDSFFRPMLVKGRNLFLNLASTLREI